MALDVYLRIDGISGESADDQHRGWIECAGAHWRLPEPKSATASPGGGHRAERCEYTEVSVIKLADLASPLLLHTCAAGKTIATAKLEFLRADGQGERVKYFGIELENLLVGHVTPAIEPGALLSEHVGLKFSKVKWKYTRQKIGGGAGGNTAGGWDLSAIALPLNARPWA